MEIGEAVPSALVEGLNPKKRPSSGTTGLEPTAKKPKTKAVPEEPEAPKTFTPLDDYILKEAVANRTSFVSATRASGLTAKFSPSDFQARWRQLLYDPEVSDASARAMASLVLGKRRKPDWSDGELALMNTAIKPDFEGAEKLVLSHRTVFLPSRTIGLVDASCRRIKNKALKATADDSAKQTAPVRPTRKAAAVSLADQTPPTVVDLDDQPPPPAAPAKRSKVTVKRTAKAAAAVLPPAPLDFNTYTWDAHPDTLAIIYGKSVFYEVTSTPVIIGRKAKESANQILQVNLADEGDASTISRHQATIDRNAKGRFTITQVGKATTMVASTIAVRDEENALPASCELVFSGIPLQWHTRPN